MNGSSCYFSDMLVLHVLSTVTVRGGKAREVMCRCERIQFDDLGPSSTSLPQQTQVSRACVRPSGFGVLFLIFVLLLKEGKQLFC